MKKIFIILGLLGLFLNNYAQDLERDNIEVNVELTVRDTTINDLIDAHTSATSVGAENGLTKTGSNIGLDGTLIRSTEIEGAGYSLELGTSGSKVGTFEVNSNDEIYLNSSASQFFESNGIEWIFNGDYWISQNNDTLQDGDAVNAKIQAYLQIIPFNYSYTYDPIITDSRPGIGKFRLDNATYASVNYIFIDYFDSESVDKSNNLQLADTGSYITITDGTNYINYQLTGALTAGGSYYKYEVTYQNNFGVISGAVTISMDLSNSVGGAGGVSDKLLNATDTITLVNDTLSMASQILDAQTVVADTIHVADSLYTPSISSGGDDLNIVSWDGIAGPPGGDINIEADNNIEIISNGGSVDIQSNIGSDIKLKTDDGSNVIRIAADTVFADGTNSSTENAIKAKYLESEVSKADTLIGDIIQSDTIKALNNTDVVIDAELGLHRADRINLSVEGNAYEIYQNNATEMTISNNSTPIISINTIGTTIEGQVQSDRGVFNDSIYVGDTWITGADASGKFTIDTTETNVLILDKDGTPDTITGALESKYVMENTEVDSLNISGYTIRFNASEGVHEFLTAKDGVIWQGALEDLFQFYNNTGQTIDDFTPLYYSGINGDSILTCDYATAAISFTVLRYAGMSTGSVPDGSWGFGNRRGKIRDVNTSLLSQIGSVFLGVDSLPTMTKPAYPNEVLVLGGVIKVGTTDGVFYHDPSLALRRELESRDYSFTTQGILAGTYYRGGFYDWTATDANLNQGSTTVTHGSANIAYSAHGAVVCGGAGTTDAGVVGLRITGTSITDAGVRATSDADTIITDITAVALNEMYEGKKFIGQITFELITISGSPTTYAFDFNHGLSKYEDANNNDFYIIGLECVGLAGANDTDFNIELLHHKSTGWTYAATGFVPGNGGIASWGTDLGTEDNLANGQDFAWKRSNLTQFIEGNDSEGAIFRITTGASASVQSMDMHILISLDE